MSNPHLSDWSTARLEREVARLEARVAERAAVAGAVARRTLFAVLVALDDSLGRQDVDDRLREGGIDPKVLRGRRGSWVPWPVYQQVTEAFDALGQDGRARGLGAQMVHSPYLRFLPLGARALPSLETTLRWVARVATGSGGLLFRGCEATVRPHSPTAFVVTFRPPLGGRVGAFWVEVTAGALSRIVELVDSPTARVVATHDGVSARFVVDSPGRRGTSRFPRRTRRDEARFAGAIADARDELAQRNVEARQQIQEFETSERERTALQDNLEHEQKMEAIGRLAGGVAHDFNNLLTIVLAQLDLLDRTIVDDASRGDLTSMRAAAERAAVLARRLLAVGRRQPLQMESVVLDQALGKSLELLASAAGETVTVEFALGARDARVRVDFAQLERCLVELTFNAAEAIPDGGVVTVTTAIIPPAPHAREGQAATAGAGGRLRLSVRDVGTGMDPEVRERAFEPYFTTRSERRAAGLGLTTIHGFVTQLGGRVEIRSTPGHGTTVDLFIPLIEGTP